MYVRFSAIAGDLTSKAKKYLLPGTLQKLVCRLLL